MATITRTLNFPWTEQHQWTWPAEDRKLIQVAATVEDLEIAMTMIPEDSRRLALQAGGACGIWPKRLAQEFGTVVTFEPDAVNFACLKRNAREENIYATRAALGASAGSCTLIRNYIEDANAGAWYAQPANGYNGSTQVVAIDDLKLPALDFLCLDVEGAERDVFEGADRTIATFRPVIMFEHKPLPHAPMPQATQWLTGHGYRFAASVHRDQIWAPI